MSRSRLFLAAFVLAALAFMAGALSERETTVRCHNPQWQDVAFAVVETTCEGGITVQVID